MLHPSKTISDKYPNYANKDKLSNLLVTRQEEKLLVEGRLNAQFSLMSIYLMQNYIQHQGGQQ